MRPITVATARRIAMLAQSASLIVVSSWKIGGEPKATVSIAASCISARDGHDLDERARHDLLERESDRAAVAPPRALGRDEPLLTRLVLRTASAARENARSHSSSSSVAVRPLICARERRRIWCTYSKTLPHASSS